MGVGALMASSLEPRSPYYRKLRASAYELAKIDWPGKATEALADGTKSEDVRAVGFVVAEWAASTNPAAFPMFVRGMLEGGNKLDDVINVCFGATRPQFFNATGGFLVTGNVPVATISVPGDQATIQAAIDAAPAGALIRVGSGTFPGRLVIERPLSLVGAADGSTTITAGGSETVITIRGTHDVKLAQLVVSGGEYGVLVEESRAVQIVGSWIRDAGFVGIRVSRSSALIQGNEVHAGMGAYGMGVELANTMSRSPSTIRNNVVSGSTKEGIVLHNAEAMIERNIVRGNGFRGIAINEMSMATVTGNTIRDNGDAGIAVVDHSMAEIDGNEISGVRPAADGTAVGIRSFYYAEVMLGRNRITADDAMIAGGGGTFESHASR
jgi:parallel beta-helix repeat protein